MQMTRTTNYVLLHVPHFHSSTMKQLLYKLVDQCTVRQKMYMQAS